MRALPVWKQAGNTVVWNRNTNWWAHNPTWNETERAASWCCGTLGDVVPAVKEGSGSMLTSALLPVRQRWDRPLYRAQMASEAWKGPGLL